MPRAADDRDADSVDESPPPRARRPSSFDTATDDGGPSPSALRLERIETTLDHLRDSVDDCRRDMRAVVKALEGRTRVSEQCLGLVRRLVDGVIAPTRGTITLAALAVLAITVVLAPSVLVQTAPEVTSAVVQWMRGERIHRAEDGSPRVPGEPPPVEP